MQLPKLHNRFDVIIKHIYAKHLSFRTETTWAKDLYTNHIKVFNGYIEDDGNDKLGKEQFLNAYHNVLESIQSKGFDVAQGEIPMGSDGTIINGAHRLAACLYYNKLPVFNEQPSKGPKYNYDFFKKRSLSSKYLDAAAIEYCRINPNAFLVFLYPSIGEVKEESLKILKDAGDVVYEKEIHITKGGQTRLMRQLYKGENWVGTKKDDYSGATRKGKWCFQNKSKVKVLLLNSELEKLTIAKLKFRDTYGLGKHSIHSTDNQEEVLRIAQQVFNENSLHFINYSREKNFPKYSELVAVYQDWLKELNLDEELFCIDGSVTMAAYGIRDSRDLDYIHIGEKQIHCKNDDLGNHNYQLKYHPINKSELILNPDNYFYYDGVKYVSLDIVKRMKNKRNELKDKHDIQLIEAFLSGKKEPIILSLKIKMRKMATKTYAMSKLRDIKLFMQMKRIKVKNMFFSKK